MKKIKDVMLIFSILLVLGAIFVGSCKAQEPNNYLKIKGEILNDHNANITVYVDKNNDDNWTKVANKNIHSKYKLRLATDKNYQVFFANEYTPTKVVHIKAGEPGMYIEFVDINFEDSSERHACMYQNDKGYYTFQTKITYASLE